MDITVRRAEPGDFEGIWRNFSDESAYSGTLQLPMPSRELWRKRLAEPAEGHYVFVACAGEEIAGHAGLHPGGHPPQPPAQRRPPQRGGRRNGQRQGCGKGRAAPRHGRLRARLQQRDRLVEGLPQALGRARRLGPGQVPGDRAPRLGGFGAG